MSVQPEKTVSIGDQPLQQFLTYRLSRVQSKLNAQASAILQKQAGLTLSRWRILSLVGSLGETRLSELARATEIDKGLLSRNLKGLIADGLITAESDDYDHRVQHLRLSPAGQKLFDETLPKMRRRQAILREPLLPKELEAFRSALEKLETAAEWRGEDL